MIAFKAELEAADLVLLGEVLRVRSYHYRNALSGGECTDSSQYSVRILQARQMLGLPMDEAHCVEKDLSGVPNEPYSADSVKKATLDVLA